MPVASERWAESATASVDLFGHVLGRAELLINQVSRDSREVMGDARQLYRQVSHTALRWTDLVRGAPRWLRILREVGRLAASYRIEHARGQVTPRSDQAMEELHRENAERIYQLCVDLGGGVLKVGQFLSCRPDLLPASYIDTLARLRDRVPPVAFDAIAEVIERELGPDRFASIDPEPVATASLAQVHRATRTDGRAVAIKVRLPGLEKTIAADAAAMTIAARLAADSLPGTDVETVVRELIRALREEIDFAVEADNLEQAARDLDPAARALVPAVHRDLSTSAVLTMDLVGGPSLGAYLETATGDQRTAILASLVDILCAQILRHGLFHGDPHPGNFLVTADATLALLDFGCVGRLSPSVRAAYAQAVVAAMTGDGARLAGVLTELGFVGRPESLAAAADVLLEAVRDRDALARMAVDPQAALLGGLEQMRSTPIEKVPHHFVLLGRVFGQVGGLLIHYQPTLDLPAIVMRHLVPSALPV